MVIWMAAALAAAAFSPQSGELPRTLQAEDLPRTVEGIAVARLGVWTGHDFKFESIRTDSTVAKTTQQAFASASVLGGVQFHDHFVVLGGYEADLASKITAQVAGAYVGWRERPKARYGKGVPDEAMVYAGAVFGRIEVDQEDFGSFKSAIGFGGGLALGWEISRTATIQLFGEYRFLRFDYERDVQSGDDSIGGNTVWVGVGIDFRF